MYIFLHLYIHRHTQCGGGGSIFLRLVEAILLPTHFKSFKFCFNSRLYNNLSEFELFLVLQSQLSSSKLGSSLWKSFNLIACFYSVVVSSDITLSFRSGKQPGKAAQLSLVALGVYFICFYLLFFKKKIQWWLLLVAFVIVSALTVLDRMIHFEGFLPIWYCKKKRLALERPMLQASCFIKIHIFKEIAMWALV